jgi:4-diphosphocytidyl-2-C-methyl-D-erythritol kinase
VSERKWVHASAAGKVNLFFGVGSLKTDGYHDVLSVYQALSLREDVSVSRSVGAPHAAVAGNIRREQLDSVPRGESNLVFKAVRLLETMAGLEPTDVDFEIFKRVPVAGGMAGGSADAAAALLAANEFLNTGFSRQRLLEESVRLGADVPFGIMGGTAIGVGRGEKLERLELGRDLHLVMVANDEGLSTPEVYAELDRQREADGADPRELGELTKPQPFIDALQGGDLVRIAALIHNDLEPAALALLPELELTLAAAEKYGALRAFVSGSGPTVAALVETADDALALQTALRHANFDAFATTSSQLGAQVEQGEAQ